MADVVPQPPPPGEYGVFWLDLRGRVTRWSTEAQEVFGHTEEEAVGLTLHELFPESDQAAGVPARALEAARDRGAWDGIGWRVTRSGESFWSATSLTMVYTPNGLGIGVMAVVRRLETSLAADVDFDAKRLASLGRVASEVSHDVRNILSAIRGFAAVLERRLPDGDAAHQVWHELVKACDRGADLTERVLGVARSDASAEGPVSLSETVLSLRPMLRQIVPPRIRLDIHAPEEVGPIFARRHDIELAILNVVVNARDAISGPGLIDITLSEERTAGSTAGEWVVLSVRDSGQGMSPDIQDRIFDRFFTTKGTGRGTGLGMAMVRDSVRAAGGSIEIESAQGTGTVVRMLFDPNHAMDGEVASRGTLLRERVQSQAASPGAKRAAAGPGGGLPAAAGGRVAADGLTGLRRTVLVWCCSPVLRSAAAELLSRRGYGVQVAVDEEMANRVLEDPSLTVDCVVVDPGADLSSVHNRRAAEGDGTDGPPVIGLVEGRTRHGADEAGTQQGILADADRVLSMPLDPRLLFEAVQQLASEYEERRASVH